MLNIKSAVPIQKNQNENQKIGFTSKTPFKKPSAKEEQYFKFQHINNAKAKDPVELTTNKQIPEPVKEVKKEGLFRRILNAIKH